MSSGLSAKAQAALEYVRENAISIEEMNSEMAAHVKRLWAQPCIKEVYELRSNFQAGLVVCCLNRLSKRCFLCLLFACLAARFRGVLLGQGGGDGR